MPQAASLVQGFGRLKGGALSLSPLFLHYEHRIVGLIFLLSIALRVLVLMQFVARENLGAVPLSREI